MKVMLYELDIYEGIMDSTCPGCGKPKWLTDKVDNESVCKSCYYKSQVITTTEEE